ncbi:MAG TPA: glucose-6-phosphate dehydrogenase [Candidatus Saccharimonadia bacterium]|nr:glucose-6-phosphate dehydrogenase [Candidatus Saccharimonadia bacterium]
MSSGLLVIFGITGDLARRYLLPALYHLSSDGLLPEHFEVIGITRRGTTVENLLANIKTEITNHEDSCSDQALQKLGASIRIVKMDMTDVAEYRALKKTLDAIEDEHSTCLNRLFYLSIPPQIFGTVVDFLGETGLNSGCQHGSSDSRIMVEKPFGYDLATAKELISRLRRSFREEQIFRIDHYLAKETVQNILTFRFSNPIFKKIWDRHSISSISISAKETIGIEGRAVFYDSVGALRDFVQNHLLQLLSVVTMNEPAEMNSTQIHAQKLKLMKHIHNIEVAEVGAETVRGQYRGYTDEVGKAGSTTETFARVSLRIEDDRWKGVPVVLETGKHLDARTAEIGLTFSDSPDWPEEGNTLLFRLQPNEGISIDVMAKKPGFELQAGRVEMAFNYDHTNGKDIHPNAYERVLIDGIRGDQTLFASSDEVLESWRIVDNVVQEWAKNGDGLIEYEPGSTPESIKSR